MMRFSRIMDRPWAWLAGGSFALLSVAVVANSRWPSLASRAEPAPVVWVADPGQYPPALLQPSPTAPKKLTLVPASLTSRPTFEASDRRLGREPQTRPAGFNEHSTEESKSVLKRLPDVDAPAELQKTEQKAESSPAIDIDIGPFQVEERETRVPDLANPTLPSFSDSALGPATSARHPGAGGSFEPELFSADGEPRRTIEMAPTIEFTSPPPKIEEPRIAQRPAPAPSPAPTRRTPASAPSPNAAAGMQSVSAQADELTRHGFSLADRGAYYSARAEFIQALRLLTQALDAQSLDAKHSRALAAGLKALDEAEDFIPKGIRLEADLNVPAIISTHQTPVLKGFSGPALPLAAVQRYYNYAQEQLATAGGNLSAASGALYGLGKVHLAMARHSADARQLAGPKAMTFHQAALTTNPGNYRAANELGVLLARYGQLAEAKRVLIVSLSTARQREAWHNLAVVHERLGEADLAKRARHEEQLLASGVAPLPDAPSRVRWVNAQEFARTGLGHDANAPAISITPRTAAAPLPSEKKSGSFSWPWK